MENTDKQAVDRRKKRVRRLKRMLIGTFFTLTVIPIVLCVVLFGLLNRANRQQQELSGRLVELESRCIEQEERLEQLTETIRDASSEQKASDAEQSGQSAKGTQGELTGEQSRGSDDLNKEGQIISRKVYLTFDDGPSINTPEILDILDQYDVKATFFVVGKESDEAREWLKQIADAGHTIGMHSYSHKYSEIYGSLEAFRADFFRLKNLISEVTGINSTIYRFPGGSSNQVSSTDMGIFADFLKEQGVSYFDWNLSSGDASGKKLTIEEITKAALDGIEGMENAMILFHDSAAKRTTVEALPVILDRLTGMEHTEILPITEDTKLIQHVSF